MKSIFAVLVVSVCLISSAFGGEISVVNPKAAFPEGPVWHQDKLFYVEYGAHTVMAWDGKTNTKFWYQEGCGPAAVIPLEPPCSMITNLVSSNSTATGLTFTPRESFWLHTVGTVPGISVGWVLFWANTT